MSSSQLAPAGSSQYTSNTMFVGDGTWDTERNTYLLPNLVGLNFDTMRYNGMGNRFRELSQYHILIRGHGVIAAITFLFIVPSAILIIRFRKSRAAVRVHIWLQILTVLLATVVFTLGWLAVGPNRSLTNPHHGIGLAIYVLVWVQAIGGWWIHSRERETRRRYEPLKVMVHHWFGRAISLLGLAQIPLGLTLYGSPKVLFILYALVASALLLVYFWLSHLQERRSDNDHDSRYNYGSGSVVEDRPRRSSIGGLLKAAAVGLGVAALLNRHRNRSQSRASHSEAVDSRRRSRHSGSRHSGSYIDDEKYSHGGQEDQARDGWKDKLLQVGVIAAAYSLVSRLMNRKRDRDQYSEASDYDPPPDRDTRISSSNVDRIEEGRPLPSRQHPLNQPSSHRRSHSSLSYPEYMSASGERRQGHGLRDAVAGLGAFGLARNIFKNRRDRKEQRRLEAQRQRDVENERRARANNQRYTGDGFPHRGSRRGSVTTSTDFSASTEDRPRYDAGIPPPVPAGAFPAGATSTTVAGQGRSRDRLHNNLPPPNPSVPALPPTDPVSMPPIPPDPRGLFHTESSGSEAYVSTGGRTHRRRSGRGAPAPTAEIVAGAAAGAAAGVAAGAAVSNDHERHQSTSGRGSVTSPPVSIKIRMHNDGRNVTLRRLPEEEALAERRRRRSRHGRRHKGSVSSLSDMNAGGKHFRRTEALERQETDAPRKESENLAAARTQEPPLQNVPVSSTAAFHPLPPPQTVPGPPPPPQNIPGPPPPPQKVPLASPPQNIPLPPPPPVPGSSQGPKPGTSGSSPGAYDLSGTEASADYASNRRRRRAERAQGKLLRDARTGSKVEFS